MVNQLRFIQIRYDLIIFIFQDQSGDTALHDAITVGNRDVIEALAGCQRFDFSIMNERGFNVLQLAAFKGDSL